MNTWITDENNVKVDTRLTHAVFTIAMKKPLPI